MMRNGFLFHLKNIFRSLDVYIFILNKANINFKNYDVMNWETNNYSTHFVQFVKK